MIESRLVSTPEAVSSFLQTGLLSEEKPFWALKILLTLAMDSLGYFNNYFGR